MLLVRNNDYNGHVALFMYPEDDFRLAPDWPLRSNLEILAEGQYDRKKNTLTALGTEYVVYPDGPLKPSAEPLMPARAELVEWLDEPVVGHVVRVRTTGRGYEAESSGTYLGVMRDEESGQPYHYFVNGEINGSPQRSHGFPADPDAEVTDERAPTRAIWDALGIPEHDCMENPVPTGTDGPLGHGWKCGVCGSFLQAG